MECLRILAMFCICFWHVVVHSGTPVFDEQYPITFNYVASQLACGVGKFGTNSFILLSGYFAVASVFKVSSIVRLWALTVFYSVTIFVILKLTGYVHFSWRAAVEVMFPICFGQYWFVSCYFYLYLISPFLIIGMRCLSAKQHLVLVMVIITVWSLIPTLIIFPRTPNGMQFSLFVWFVIMFITGAFFRLHPEYFKISNLKLFSIGVLCLLLFLAYVLFFDVLSHYTDRGLHLSDHMDRNNFFVVIGTMASFVLFTKMRVATGLSKYINAISGCLIGFYMIHDNDYMRVLLMRDFINLRDYFENPVFIPYSIFLTIIIFVAGISVDYIRRISTMELRNKFYNKLKKYDPIVKEFIVSAYK